MRIKKISKSQLSEKVAKMLRADIFTLEYARGERLIVETLADKMHVSMTPVRDGLKKLVSDGIVEYDGKTYSVFNPTERDIQNIFSIRRYLEMLSARTAATNISKELLDELFAKCYQIKENTNIGGQVFIQSDTEFHRMLVKGSGNDKLQKLLLPIEDQCYLIRLWSYVHEFPQIYIVKSVEEHISILEAIRDGDPTKAENEMEKHIVKGEKRAWNAIKKRNIFFPEPISK